MRLAICSCISQYYAIHSVTSALSCQCISQSAVAFPKIICRNLLSYPRPLNSPANASSNLQLHSPILCRTLLSNPRPLNTPAIAEWNEPSPAPAPQPPVRRILRSRPPAAVSIVKHSISRAILLCLHTCAVFTTTDFTSLCCHFLIDMTSNWHHLYFLPPSNRTSSLSWTLLPMRLAICNCIPQ